MNAHTLEQPTDPSSAGTYRYLLAHYGPLLTLKHLAEVLHSTPNGVRMTLARRRDPLSIALRSLRREAAHPAAVRCLAARKTRTKPSPTHGP